MKASLIALAALVSACAGFGVRASADDAGSSEFPERSRSAGDFIAVDVSAGPAATNYPVRYFATAEDVPGGVTNDLYKTVHILLRRIPAGSFVMGSPEGEPGRFASREAQRQVTLAKDYYMGVFPVTQKQWERVMGNWPSWFGNPAYRDSRPVERVSYFDIRENPDNSAISPNWPQSSLVHADSFMGKLRAKTGLSTLDLPTEAQWEYACRAGTGTALNSGKNLTNVEACPNMSEVGRYRHNHPGEYSDCSSASTAGGTAKAGSHAPNAWGLYDMHGNVWEWCLDWYTAAAPETTDPAGAASGSSRILRGGCWNYAAVFCRSACRDGNVPSNRNDNRIGFRLAMPLPAERHMLTVSNGTGGGSHAAGSAVNVVAEAAPSGHIFATWRVAPADADMGENFDPMAASATLTMPDHAASLTATYVRDAGDYMVIDLSGGPTATKYPVSYTNAAPAGGWTDEYKTTKLVMRRIPAGTFMMGSPESELGRSRSEARRQVTLTKDFYIGVFPVTQKQWERVTGNWPSRYRNQAHREAKPVESVTYYEIRENPLPVLDDYSKGSPIATNWPQSSLVHADSFMGKLRAKTGLSALDLPTEAQWEYACRAGTTTALNRWKNLTHHEECTNLSEVAKYSRNRIGGYGPAKVGSFLPNVWGLYDMHGNILEWCLDWYTEAPPGTTDPVGPASGAWRTMRGGSWDRIARFCRSASRCASCPFDPRNIFGLRLAMTVP